MTTITTEQGEAIRGTVPGSKWYWRRCGGRLQEVTVERVTKTLVILTNGTRITKETLISQGGEKYEPSTPEVVEAFEAQELKVAAQALYLAALRKLETAAQKATPSQLRYLAEQMGNVIDLSGIK